MLGEGGSAACYIEGHVRTIGSHVSYSLIKKRQELCICSGGVTELPEDSYTRAFQPIDIQKLCVVLGQVFLSRHEEEPISEIQPSANFVAEDT